MRLNIEGEQLMKRIICTAIWAAAFLSAGLIFASRTAKPRNGNAQRAETAPPAAENVQEAEASAQSQDAAQESPVPAPEQQREKPRRGGEGRSMEREPIVPLDDALEAAAQAEPVQLKQPEFITDDQVRLSGLYYKGNADESTIPVILLHKKEGKKEDWQELAQSLAEKGVAVLVPDLRGYGESVTAFIEDYSFGGEQPVIRQNQYNAQNFSPDDWDAMRSVDGHFWIRFLVYLHNKKMINIRKLVLIGDGYGAAVAGSWLLEDWKAPSPKKGQFTRGLLMISPDADPIFEKLGSGKTKAGKLTYKIYVGGLDKERLEAAESIGLQLAKEKSSLEPEMRKVPVENCKTEKQDMPLLKASAFHMPEQILQFVTEECQSDQEQKWQAIKNFE